MKFPFPYLTSFEDVMRNFEQIEAGGLYVGAGAPTFTPSSGFAFYFRKDTPTVVNQRIYVWNQAGPAWIGVV